MSRPYNAPPPPPPTPPTTGFARLRVGAGGQVAGFDSVGGVTVMRTDQFGAYLRNDASLNTGNDGSGGSWTQLCTTGSLPSSFWFPQGVGGFNPWNGGDGCYAIRIAPSDTNTCYMTYLGQLFVTTNLTGAHTFSATTLPAKHFVGNPTGVPGAGPARLSNYKMAIDPHNKNVVYIGGYGATYSEGIYMTIGGTTGGSWFTVPSSTIAFADTAQANVCIAFDPNAGTIAVPNLNGLGAATVTKTIAIAISGTGIYVTNDGGQTWTLLPATPRAASLMRFAPAGALGTYQAVGSHNGALYVMDNSVDAEQGDLWMVTGLGNPASATWTAQRGSYNGNLNGSLKGFDFDPTNAQRMILMTYTNAGLQEGFYSGGSAPYWTWGTWGASGTSSPITDIVQVVGDIPYLATGGFFGTGNIGCLPKCQCPTWDTFDTTRIWFAGDQSPRTWVPHSPLSFPATVTNRGAGVEEFDGVQYVALKTGTILVGSQDVAIIRTTNPDKYALAITAYAAAPNNLSQSFGGFNVAASDLKAGTGSGATICTNIGTDLSGSEFSPPQSGYSNNDGATFTPFSSQISIAFSNPANVPGNIIPASASDMLWATGIGQGAGGQVYHTTNGGSSWTPSTIPENVTRAGSGAAPICADQVNIGTYYASAARASPPVSTNGTYVSTDGINWIQSATWDGLTDGTGASDAPYDRAVNEGLSMVSVPGRAGHVFAMASAGGSGSIPIINGWTPDNTRFIYFTTNAGAHWTGPGTGAVWITVTDIISGHQLLQPWAFGIGPPAPGHSYPSLYVTVFMPAASGQWSNASLGLNYNLGHYRCIDFNTSTGAGTWTLLNKTNNPLYDFYVQWPQVGTNNLDGWISLTTFGADQWNYGHVLGTMNGAGFLYGNIP